MVSSLFGWFGRSLVSSFVTLAGVIVRSFFRSLATSLVRSLISSLVGWLAGQFVVEVSLEAVNSQVRWVDRSFVSSRFR